MMRTCRRACLCPPLRTPSCGRSGPRCGVPFFRPAQLGWHGPTYPLPPSLQPGREKQLIFSIMRKSLDLEYTDKPLEIYSAFQRDSLPGLIYVEARNRSAVEAAVQGLVGVYVSRGINLVPIDEMASLLKLTKKRVEILPGSFVRIKRGKYQGDLAQVLDITENGEEVGLKFVPRIDLRPNEDPANANGGKRKKGTMSGNMAGRPPAKFFMSEEVAKSYGARAIVKRGDQFVFQGDTYVNGFIEKDLKVTAIDTEGVIPTMDELEVFSGSGGGGSAAVEDYTKMQEQARQTAIAVLQPGDVVEVTYDQNKGAVGTVVTISEGIVTIRRTSGENAGAELTVRGEFVKKLFRQGEHVKVISGKNLDETGLVLKVEGDSVTLMSDLSKQEINAFAKDLRVASEVGSGLNAVGQHELHDLVSYRSVPARCRRLTLPSGVWTLTSVLSHGAATSTVSSTGPSATSSTCSRFRARSSRPSRVSSRAPTRSAGRRPTTSTASRSTRARRLSRLRAR
jgi:transcription elongation factor SPT5